MSIPSTSSETSPSPQPEQAHSQVASQAQQTAAAATSAPAQPPKRSSRRANTAERRATHNAVERARRETLNGRFLDLAAMLPNLAAVRRPSKSAIVNSSIALIHNQSRARIIAARELRLLNAEANALRQELNEWRARNALPRVEEPIRSADFSTLMAVEDVEMGEEMIVSGRRSFDDGTGLGDDDDYGDDGEDGAELISPETAHHPSFVGLRPPMQYQQQQQQQAQQAQLAAQQQQQQQQQQQLFEQQKAAMARAQQAQFAQAQAQQARYAPAVHHQHSQSQPVNLFTDNMFPTDLYPSGNAQSWSQKAIAANTTALATPPGSAHGHKQSPYATTANSAFLAGHGNMGGMFKPAYSASEDDQSDGSSHYSGVEHNNGAAIDQTFSFGLSSNYGMGMNLGMQVPSVNMNLYPGMSGMQMPPSPPHTSSPTGSNPQSRRPSVNIPAQHGVGLVGHNGSNKGSPSPVPMSAQQQYGMGLMI